MGVFNLVQLTVDEKALKKYLGFFDPFIHEQIKTYYNPEFLIHYAPKTYSFSFLQNEIIISTLEGEMISDIKRVGYKELIPDSFLTQLLAMECTPSRLKRYRRIGVERLRIELADELRLGAITAMEANAFWNDYQIKIKISPALAMEKIEIY